MVSLKDDPRSAILATSPSTPETIGADRLHGLRREFLLAKARDEDIGTFLGKSGFAVANPIPSVPAGNDGGLAFELFWSLPFSELSSSGVSRWIKLDYERWMALTTVFTFARPPVPFMSRSSHCHFQKLPPEILACNRVRPPPPLSLSGDRLPSIRSHKDITTAQSFRTK